PAPPLPRRNGLPWRRSPPVRGVARAGRASRAAHPLESTLEVGDEVLGLLEPDVEPDERSARPRFRAARALEVRGHDEALIAAPAVAEREALEALDERRDLRARARRELHAEKPRR